MEIRGLGVIDVMSIYGIGSIRKRKRIQMEIKLKQWDKNLEVERLGLGETYTEFLGVKIPSTTIPILPGKHISVLAEAAALNYHLKSFGYHPVKEFAKKVREAIKNETDFWEHMESDIE
jgi:HPr kinase/phosphorylase